jgi:hypothetical protein
MATVLDSGIFKLEPAPSTTNRGTALLFSNAGLLVAFDALNDYIGLGIGDRLKEISDAWIEYARQTFRP